MPDHGTEISLNQQTKRRRVDIGVKRTVSSAATFTQTASVIITDTCAAKSTVMNSCHSLKQDVLESQAAQLGHVDFGAPKSTVLRKLLKRASSYEDAMVPFHSATIIRKLLKRSVSKVSGGEQGRDEFKARQEDTCSVSSRDSPQERLSPIGHTTLCQFDSERLNDEHLRAKRARVENIIRGMSHSPNVMAHSGKDHGQEEEGETEGPPQSCSPRESYRENKRKQKLPQQQQHRQLLSGQKEQKVEERRQLKLQLEDMQKQLRQLQEKLFQMYDSTDSEPDGGNISEDSVRSDEGLIDGDEHLIQDLVDDRSDNEMLDLDPGRFLNQAKILEQALPVDKKSKRDGSLRGKDFISLHEESKHLTETLKQELNSAMSQVVETVVKVFSKPLRPALQVYPSLPPTQDCFVNGDNPNFQRVQCLGDLIIPGPPGSFGGAPLPSGNNQTEALSLVVRKSASEHHQSSALGGHPHPSLHTSSLSANMGFSNPSFRHPFPLPFMSYSFQNALGAGYSGKDQGSLDSMDLSRETISVQTKMASGHHLRHHRSCSPVHLGTAAEGLSLSFIKSECGDLQDMSDILPYSGSTIQEGLSPNHLKKAKLMFFYARYPSSNMLKMYFSDVKFNRCITSQLIKWFSNFREFYYIQMEKFARQTVSDGVLSADDLSVSFDSELYRVLNMHYNKSNGFQVPERFLEVAQITLREFFNAVVSGKDADPSWKKAIYKVICKLDCDVPEIFKSKNCLQELLHD